MEKVYFIYRNEFIHWSMNKYGISENTALDDYQDSITILFEKIINGSIGEIESSLKTYLFGIGKNRIRQGLVSAERKEKHGDNLAEHYRFLSTNNEANDIYLRAKEATKKVFETIGEPCKTILRKFYFEKLSMQEIASDMNYKNEGVARTTKKRCLEKIRDNFIIPA